MNFKQKFSTSDLFLNQFLQLYGIWIWDKKKKEKKKHSMTVTYLYVCIHQYLLVGFGTYFLRSTVKLLFKTVQRLWFLYVYTKWQGPIELLFLLLMMLLVIMILGFRHRPFFGPFKNVLDILFILIFAFNGIFKMNFTGKKSFAVTLDCLPLIFIWTLSR